MAPSATTASTMAPRLLCFAGSLGMGLRPAASSFISNSQIPHQVTRLLSVLSSPEDGECSSEPSKVKSIEKLSSFTGKVVPLGGNFSVRRILPYMKQRSVGPFVFLDHFGPVALEEHAMNVGPHPHIGLMTITYLYEGAILHRDSTGAEQIILPGEVNGMISGIGVTHSERGKLEDITPHLEARNLGQPSGSHGLQMWMALSKEGEDVKPSFHHGKSVAMGEDASLIVGQTNGHAQTIIPVDPYLGKVVYADIYFSKGNTEFELFQVGGAADNQHTDDSSMELGVYVTAGELRLQSGWGNVDGTTIEAGNMVVVKIPDASCFRGSLQALSPSTRVAVLGGTPLPEKRYILWNFVATSKAKVEQAAEAWNVLDRRIFPKVTNEANEDSIPLAKR